MEEQQLQKRIAILGSSGGNLRSQGGDDPAGMVDAVRRQAESAGFEIVSVQIVSAGSSMDGIGQDAPAKLWSFHDGDVSVLHEGSLSEVNKEARILDREIASKIDQGEIDGLVLMSCDPDDTNSEALAAAARREIPAAGTGGTSIAKAQQSGVNLVASSGTTGTSSTTRAVAYVSGLAHHWGVKFRPDLGSRESSASERNEPAWKRISIRGIMVGSIPAFITLALILAFSKIPALAALTEVFELLIAGLPIIVSAVAARRISGLDEVGLVAGAVAGILAAKGGLLGGLVSGILAGLLASWLIRWTLSKRFPATTANIVTGSVAAIIPGLLVFFVLAPATGWLGEGVKLAIEWAVSISPLLAGALAGLAMWPAIMGGVYHSVILPLVLLEMGEKGHSFFGAVDMVALVMVSLGITLANVLKPRTSGERALAGSGAGVNFFFGTFVEASYPFMFGDKRVFAIAIASAGVGGAIVGVTGSEATAYLPAVVAPFVSTNVAGFVIAMVITCAMAFMLTLLANINALRKKTESTPTGLINKE